MTKLRKPIYSRKRLGGNAGPGSRGTGSRGTGSGGKHGVWKTRGVENTGSQWKTRGLSAKHSGTIISPDGEVEMLLFQISMKINRLETRFLVIKAN